MKRLMYLLGATVAALTLGAAAAGATNAPVAAESSSFLCYSAYQVEPGVWPVSQAETLYSTFGYWQPFALKGNVTGGTNLGAYHLTCNLAPGSVLARATATSSGTLGDGIQHEYVGSGGAVYGVDLHDAMANTLGFYPLVP
jgi:hypothetical protein